jgi:FMN phosphatase YigB (HAD superfamily)
MGAWLKMILVEANYFCVRASGYKASGNRSRGIELSEIGVASNVSSHRFEAALRSIPLFDFCDRATIIGTLRWDW